MSLHTTAPDIAQFTFAVGSLIRPFALKSANVSLSDVFKDHPERLPAVASYACEFEP